jgi:aminoglycoside phosphotransferase (APT) family kinase protein
MRLATSGPAGLSTRPAVTGIVRRMPSPTQRSLVPDDVLALARASFGPRAGVVDCAELPGGGFAAVWRVRLADGRTVVLKVAPPSAVPLLRYERDLVAAEAQYFRFVRERAGAVPVPEVLHLGSDPSVLDGDWLFTSHLPGIALPEQRAADSTVDDAAVRRDLGRAVARLHAVQGTRYGYPGGRPHGDTWRAAFGSMVDALLADAVDWRVPLPEAPSRIRELVAGNAQALAAVDRPALLHFDLWDGNVLAAPDATGRLRLTGLVDGERYLFGDPLMDLVSPVLFRRIEDEPDHPFLHGYAEAVGAPVRFDAAARRRLALYRMHLYLLMTVEMPSRGMTSRARPERHRLLQRLLGAELAELGRPLDR